MCSKRHFIWNHELHCFLPLCNLPTFKLHARNYPITTQSAYFEAQKYAHTTASSYKEVAGHKMFESIYCIVFLFCMNQIALPKETMFMDLVVWLSTLRSLKNVRENVLWIRHVLLLTGSRATSDNPVGFWRHPMWDLQRNLELLLTTCSWTELAWVSRLSYTFNCNSSALHILKCLEKVCDIPLLQSFMIMCLHEAKIISRSGISTVRLSVVT